MSRTITVKLESVDVLQILDALDSRATAYEKTALILKGQTFSDLLPKYGSSIYEQDALDMFFVPEECADASEAEAIAKHFRDIITTLEAQM